MYLNKCYVRHGTSNKARYEFMAFIYKGVIMKFAGALVLVLFSQVSLAKVETDELRIKAVKDSLIDNALTCTAPGTRVSTQDMGFSRLFPNPKLVIWGFQSQLILKSLYGDRNEFEAVAEISTDESEKKVTGMTISLYGLGPNLGTIVEPNYERTLLKKLECR
jgi:hypothetical protein